MNTTTKVDHAQRKRGRPAGEAGPRKRKHPAAAAAAAAEASLLGSSEEASQDSAAAVSGPVHVPVGLGITHAPQHEQALPTNAGPPPTPQTAYLPQAQTLAPGVPPYTTVFAEPNMGNAPLYRTNVLLPYEYTHMYGSLDLDNGSESNDGASSGGPTNAPTPFVIQTQSPMISHVPGPQQLQHQPQPQHPRQQHLQQLPPAPYMSAYNPYLGSIPSYDGAVAVATPQMGGMGMPQHQQQQVHGLGIRAPGPFYDPATGQVFAHPMGAHLEPQFIARPPQHFMAPSPMLQHAPTMMQPPQQQPVATPRLASATGPAHNQATGTPRVAAAQLPHGQVPATPRLTSAVPPQGAPRPMTASKSNAGSTPIRAPTPGHVPSSPPHSSVIAPTPRLHSATMTATPQRGPAQTPHMSPMTLRGTTPMPLHAPTPMTCMSSPGVVPATPPPVNTPLHPPTPRLSAPNAPTPFASSASSDLSSVPPDSPAVSREQLVNSRPTPRLQHAPLASVETAKMPPHASPADHSGCVPIATHTAVQNQLNSYKNNFQLLRTQLAKLAPADRAPCDDIVMAIAKRIMECEGRANALSNNETMLRVELDKLATIKDETEAHVHRLERELAMVRQQAAQANALAVHFRDECATHEQRKSGQESNNAYFCQQIDIRDQEIAALRAEVNGAHDTLARLVAVSGITMAEVQPASPTHLSLPLERSRSHSFPLTPIYTPAQALPTESLPPSQSVLFSSDYNLPEKELLQDETATKTSDSSHGSESASASSENDFPMPATPVRSNSLPIQSSTPSAAKFTPRLCLTPREKDASLGTGFAATDVGSPWKSWLQLDNMSSKN